MNAAATGHSETTVWADAHNHLHDPEIAGRAAGPCLVNATREGDWDAVLATAAQSADRHAALGIHPWFAATAEAGWMDRLRNMLETNPRVGVGECGLDSKTRECPMEAQIPVFTRQIRLARESDRPLTIHCVGAWGRLIDALDREPPPSRWLLHSFNGSAEIARQLAGMGACFSISGRALHPAGAKTLRVFQEISPDRILLETDAPNATPPKPFVTCELPGGGNAPENLAAIGTEVATRLGADPQEFAARTHRNFLRFSGNAGIHPPGE